MSEDLGRGKKKGKPEDEEAREDKSTPDILDPTLVKWAERCFQGDERPQIFIVHQLLGRTGKAEGSCVRRQPVAHLKEEGGVRHEMLVSICNSLIEEMQDEADNMRQPRRFVVTAHSDLKGGEFARKTIERTPKNGIVKLGERSLAGLDGEGDEVDLLGGDILRKRADVVLQDGRFYAELMGQVLGGTLQTALQQNREKDDMIKELFRANMDLARQANEAANNALDRELIRAEREVVLAAKRKGISLLAGLVPDFLKKVTGGAVDMPGGRTAESMAIEAVMDEKGGGLSSEEKHKIFGDWTDGGERLTPGILSENQVRIIVGTLNEKIPLSEFDRLITDGDPNQLTVEQYTQIMSVLKGDLDKLLPLVNVLKSRKEALDKKLAASKPEAKPES